MKVLLVFAEDYPWDVRIEKVIISLLRDGACVYLLCRNVEGREPWEVCNGLQMRRVGPPWLPRWARWAVSIPAFFNPVWASAMAEVLRKQAPDVVIVRDVPLAPLAIALGHAAGRPVVIDMAENHPAMWRDLVRRSERKWVQYILKNPWIGQAIERASIKRADHVFVVVDEMRERLEGLGVPRERITIVSNTPANNIATTLVQPSPCGGAEDRTHALSIVYVGYVTPGRGLQDVIAAIARMSLSPGRPEVRLHILGSGPFCGALVSLSRRCGMTNNVIFHGWVPAAKVPAILAQMDVGIVPHRKSEHTETTIPNKLFDYMAGGIPVLVSDVRPMRRIVLAERCGVVFRAGDVDDLADALAKLHSPAERRALGARGRNAVRRSYNWDRDWSRARKAITQASVETRW